MEENSSPHESTYIFNAESASEIARLIDQDRMITRCMGGPLAEQPHLEQFHTILDLACGPGYWATELAFIHPTSTIIGIDSSHALVDYANTQAWTQQLNNITFKVMDIRQPLDFADQSFDLINARLLMAVLHRDMWFPLIEECARLLKPGGTLRLTETDGLGISLSPAYQKLGELGVRFLHQAGFGFSPTGRMLGITPALPWLLRKAGLVEIGSTAHALRFSRYDDTYTDMLANIRISTLQSRPLVTKSGMITEEEFDALYLQMETEVLSNDFSAIIPFLTAWGHKPA